jgi:hypothetical protein
MPPSSGTPRRRTPSCRTSTGIVRPPLPTAMLVSTAAARGDRPGGDIMRKAFFNLYLSWLLVFGGSGTLLRRVA